MNKRIKKSLAVIFGAVLATGLVACSGAEGDNRESVRDSGKIETSPEENTETTKNQSDLNGENSLSSDEGYEGLFAAAMAIADGENFPALSATGNFDFTSYGEGENSQRKLNVQKIGIRADGKMKKAEGKIKGISAKIVISSDDEKEIVFETYLKDGKTYSFTNLFGESYDYDEESSEPEFDFGEIDETDLRNRFNDLKGRIPAPETAKTGDEFTVTWRINGDNIADYYNAFKKAFYAENDDQTEGNEVPSQVEGESGSIPDDETLTQTDGQNTNTYGEQNSDMTDGQNSTGIEESGDLPAENTGDYASDDDGDKIVAILKSLNINQCFLTVTVRRGTISQIKFNMDMSRGEEGVKGEASLTFDYENVEPAFPQDRLDEIKRRYGEGREEQGGNKENGENRSDNQGNYNSQTDGEDNSNSQSEEDRMDENQSDDDQSGSERVRKSERIKFSRKSPIGRQKRRKVI